MQDSQREEQNQNKKAQPFYDKTIKRISSEVRNFSLLSYWIDLP